MKPKKLEFLAILCFAFMLLIPRFPFETLQPEFTNTIYDDSLAAGWLNWSWATTDLAVSSPVHSGSHSIGVTFGAWQGFFLHNAAVDTTGTTTLRFYEHGGATGGQKMNVYMNLEVNGSAQTGPAVALPLPPANNWAEVQIPLSMLNPQNRTITGITWQDTTGGGQPTFYIDDIALTSPQDPNGPQLSAGSLTPQALPADSLTTLAVRAYADDPQGAADLSEVTVDASSLGRGIVAMDDDGHSNDGASGDGLYGVVLTAAVGTPAGEKHLLVQATDKAGHQTSLAMGTLVVLSSPGGSIPLSLPQRIGWGSNAWSETPGQDWQVNSGVPWDYVYQYITYGWESWGGDFVSRFVHQAWDKHYVPMVVIYMLLAVPPNCGEGGSCYAQKLQNASTVQSYLDSLQRAAQEASGSKPVIFNIEPDFYGYMQQLSNSSGRPAGVIPDDPASFPVALNKSGYANNLAGFGRYLVDLIHSTAPNVLVAPMASVWATNSDPQSVTDSAAVQMGQRTAVFIDAMGGAQSDLMIVEWSDRDAGSGLRPWWDDTDHTTPRPTRAILWENAVSRTSNKRLLLWQMPVGNMSLDNTPTHYQDNRAAYVFSHQRDLFDAGIFGVLFGGGNGDMTQVDTDGGFVAAQGTTTYAPPAAPVGLAAASINGPLVNVHWNENSEPDLWKYRLSYQLTPGGAVQSIDVGRRNAYTLLLPTSGTWVIRVSAVDAMGNTGAPSASLLVTTNQDASHIYLPVVRHSIP